MLSYLSLPAVSQSPKFKMCPSMSSFLFKNTKNIVWQKQSCWSTLIRKTQQWWPDTYHDQETHHLGIFQPKQFSRWPLFPKSLFSNSLLFSLLVVRKEKYTDSWHQNHKKQIPMTQRFSCTIFWNKHMGYITDNHHSSFTITMLQESYNMRKLCWELNKICHNFHSEVRMITQNRWLRARAGAVDWARRLRHCPGRDTDQIQGQPATPEQEVRCTQKLRSGLSGNK